MTEIITAECAEELSQVVTPWNLDLRQLAPGKLDPHVAATAVNDLIVTNDRWEGHLQGLGCTPSDCVTFCGVTKPLGIRWNGLTLEDICLPTGSGGCDWEFRTPQGTNHWVIMIPEAVLAGHMGVDKAVVSRLGSRLLQPEIHRFQRLHMLAVHSLQRPTEFHKVTPWISEALLREQILETAGQILNGSLVEPQGFRASKRALAHQRALRHIDSYGVAATPASAATAAGVSLRVLQMAFQEQMGITPKHYIRLCQLNRLHASLHNASADNASVTELMEECGFHEFGRIAGQYCRLFGELPSQTLRKSAGRRPRSVLDAVHH